MSTAGDTLVADILSSSGLSCNPPFDKGDPACLQHQVRLDLHYRLIFWLFWFVLALPSDPVHAIVSHYFDESHKPFEPLSTLLANRMTWILATRALLGPEYNHCEDLVSVLNTTLPSVMLMVAPVQSLA